MTTVPMPYPEDTARTHYEGCYHSRGHHNCAIAEIQRLRSERGQLAYAVIHWCGTEDVIKHTAPLAARVLWEDRQP